MKHYTELTLTAIGLTIERPSILLVGEDGEKWKLTHWVGQKVHLVFPQTKEHIFHFHQ